MRSQTRISHEKTREPKPRQIKELEYLKEICKKEEYILHLDCGKGRAAVALAKAGYNVACIDSSPELIDKARLKAKGIHLQLDVGSITQLPYSPLSFDKVLFLNSSFNHLLAKSDQVQALNEMHRVLRGLAVVEMFNGENKLIMQELLKRGEGPDKRWLKQGGVMTYIHDRSTLTGICEISNFQRYKVLFQNIGGRRRLIMFLYK
ncbi:MAG: class I SAM-dependent methyltransferase [Nanobdellota archaeon]